MLSAPAGSVRGIPRYRIDVADGYESDLTPDRYSAVPGEQVTVSAARIPGRVTAAVTAKMSAAGDPADFGYLYDVPGSRHKKGGRTF